MQIFLLYPVKIKGKMILVNLEADRNIIKQNFSAKT